MNQLTELQAGLAILQAHCTRGKVIVEANARGVGINVTLRAPKNEQSGLLDKLRSVAPFKGKEQLISLWVDDLKFYECRLEKYMVYISDT
ncbi:MULTISPECIES: hypothetical protein [Vibrio]|jgi:hypothetical protein|uniref:Uncharacterized protein n=3 Tax=Vibrio TaxID=662 RepID=A0A7Z1MHZ2_9VIBR|nr:MULTISPECIES: hypothetical protein [Vibrio]KAA8675671.1 hypothetical protein F4W18_13695 [Vibrio gigantis]MDA0155480.1 hypothetical protein [Vibrio sp. Makdt]PMM25259.1 hypothetical protein BCT58_00440 [Vibrio lentus]PMM78715.1 hypothetical protein BCT48_00145 [Vibrio sp. 10N.261.46.F12]PMP24538.1 hypothetical protein BCS91_13595 [Vibrio cyclitrophicus]